ncbi:MAG: 30S ribosomal protein S6 [Clostridia bacterium]|jgi:small subunit ribosomal protein S6|nr:30S ribosomal protein S6 [Clostridia bacterium]NLF37304.1 30S ribosomal protein S6 [Clostridiaceae bacterium]MDD3092794.1 30S ribosomal protein S6 [Clostridia bacterium]MDD3971882.1 30S ribosomal protein S6 [Clostridia bacterium]MDD4543646.1 30S ribosomal protein S6 [Clostridia bacterium]
MNQYETIFIVDCTLEEEAQKNTVEKLIQQMTDAGCEIDKVDEWGKKKLAYPINYKTDGYFVLVTFKAQPDFISELERLYRITEGIIKGQTIKL